MLKNFFLLFLFFLFSCGSDEDQVPGTVLPKDKLVSVLTQVHLAEAEQQQKVLGQAASPADTFSFEEIFKKEKITRAQYDSSMKFYAAHPKLLDQVYDEVINELNKMQAEEMKKKK